MIYTEEMKWFVQQINASSLTVLTEIIGGIKEPLERSLKSKETKNEEYEQALFHLYFLNDLSRVLKTATKEIMETMEMEMDQEGLFFFEPDVLNFNEYRKGNYNDFS